MSVETGRKIGRTAVPTVLPLCHLLTHPSLLLSFQGAHSHPSRLGLVSSSGAMSVQVYVLHPDLRVMSSSSPGALARAPHHTPDQSPPRAAPPTLLKSKFHPLGLHSPLSFSPCF